MAKPSFPVQLQETIDLQPVGLWTYPNPLSAVPKGALTIAENLVLDRPHVLEPRRGINPIGPAFTANANKLYGFQNQVVASYSNKLSYYSSDFLTRTDYSGTFSPPTGAITIHSTLANKNIYFTTSTGVKKLDSIAGSITFAGAPAGLDGSGTTTGVGWFTNNTQVAYRILFGYTDANGNLILGAPSQRIVVSNSSGGTTNVSLTFTLPAGLTTSWEYQIYRSPMSANLTTEPNDECALVFTGNPTGTDLTNGYITLTDTIDDSLKGAFIYTASSQQGIAQANYQPPIATDVTTFRNFTFYANTTSQQQFLMTLVAVGAPALQNGDTLTIGGITYTGQATENIGTGQFQIFTGGTPSQNITNTANSIVRVINRHVGSTVYAYYQSGYSDLPGRIQLTERGIGGAPFTVACSRSGAFTPNIGLTTGTSLNLNSPNYVFISKFQQPEAVPLLQFIPVGAADKSILRIISLRDYILIFKQDGVFQIVGTDTNSFQALLVDSTTILRGIETAVALNNKVFLFSTQTVISLTYNEGAILKSQPIKQDLLTLSSPLFPGFDNASFGIAYESENKYILGTVTNTTDTVATQYFVYNYITDAWTQWIFPFNMKTGFVNPLDNKLYFGSGDSNSRFLYQERKNYAVTDYADNSYPVTVTGSSGTTVNLTSTTNVQVGFTLSQSDTIAIVKQIVNSTDIKVDRIATWVNGAALAYTPIPLMFQFIPEPCGNPGIVKQFKEIHTVFSAIDFTSVDLGCSTDFSEQVTTFTLVPKLTGFGNQVWGNSPWGSGSTQLPKIIRGLVPITQRRGHWLIVTLNESLALTHFALDGFVIYYQQMSQKFH